MKQHWRSLDLSNVRTYSSNLVSGKGLSLLKNWYASFDQIKIIASLSLLDFFDYLERQRSYFVFLTIVA